MFIRIDYESKINSKLNLLMQFGIFSFYGERLILWSWDGHN